MNTFSVNAGSETVLLTANNICTVIILLCNILHSISEIFIFC